MPSVVAGNSEKIHTNLLCNTTLMFLVISQVVIREKSDEETELGNLNHDQKSCKCSSPH